ncbi:ABC transporter permease subunit [Enemella sp. A6]|uniref:ABC transporter permease subunit n=1 Tax=Enemella sp. A6 TaxID=3440152 RepID=UPI003EB88839
MSQPEAPPERRTKRARESHATAIGPGFFLKLVLMALINALGVYIIYSAWVQKSWIILAVTIFFVVLADIVYFTKRMLPLKYLLPGLTFLLIYQVFTVGYTGYVAFTNYGAGHNSDKADAIAANIMQNQRRVEGSKAMPLVVVEKAFPSTDLGFAVVQDDVVKVGTKDQPLEEVPDAVVEGTTIKEVPGWKVLSWADAVSRSKEVTELRVPVSEDANAGSIGTQDARTGYAYRSVVTYDPQTDSMTHADTGKVYKANKRGQFEADDGSTLTVGWRVFVGAENFTTAFSDARYSGPFLKVLTWNVVFALASVLSTFFLGLFLAIVMNSERMRGRKIYRTLMLLPYAFPAFLTALLFKGMLNRDFGFVNEVLLGGMPVAWLSDPWLAKLAIIVVNLWMGFPYMFLIATGTLQAIPSDVYEAAKIDGATGWQQFRQITLPLLLIAVTPLLISSFAFNFNNFNLVYMLTGGGPRFTDTSAPIGATDLLITMVYSVSGLDGSAARNYGLASALSIVIFLIVATVSAISFRLSQKMED